MLLPEVLLEKRVHDTVLKQVANAAYDIQTAQGKTETGGLFINGGVDQTITTGGTAQAIGNWTGDYQKKVIVAALVAGTLVTTADLDFDIDVEMTITRKSNPIVSKIKVEIFSDNDDVVGFQEVNLRSQVSQKINISLSAIDLSAASTLTVRLAGETVTDEVITVSDAFIYVQSTT